MGGRTFGKKRFGVLTDGVDGHWEPGFEAVAEEFARNLRDRGDLGGAFSAVVDGALVVDIWGGIARRPHTQWQPDTLTPIFSGSKGLVAICLLILIDRGQLDLSARVADYWPEFAQSGKETISVGEAVSHRAGIPGLTQPVTIEEAADSRRMAELLAVQPLLTAPGELHYYHALTYGWLCGELVRRIDGRTVGRFFDEEVAKPLQLEAWIGMPAAYELRVARVESDTSLADFKASQDIAEIEWAIWRNPPRFADGNLAANLPLWHRSEIPGTSAVASARSVARLYGHLVGNHERHETTLISPVALATGTRCLARGRDVILDQPLAFGVGFQLQTDSHILGLPPDAFGHSGAGGSVHGAWPSLRTGFSYTTNKLATMRGADPRAAALLEALRDGVLRERAARR
jgi:CubicO group peptidase (beta-lactamase class C family)